MILKLSAVTSETPPILPGTSAKRRKGSGLALRFDTATWKVPPIFGVIAGAGIEPGEMRRTFNMGLGLVVPVPAEQAAAALAALAAAGETAWRVGEVIRRDGDEVVFA